MSRTKEQRSWDTFSKAINPANILVQRTELLYSGEAFPDVLGITRQGSVFLLENKAIDGWPKRPTTKPMRGIFEPGQIGFMRSWWFKKGRAFVLLRVGLDYFLMDPRQDLEEMTQYDIIDRCEEHGKNEIITFLEQLHHYED